MISFQLGLAAFASPTIVWKAGRHLRFFSYVSLPIAQDYKADYQFDQWRAGLGAILHVRSCGQTSRNVTPPQHHDGHDEERSRKQVNGTLRQEPHELTRGDRDRRRKQFVRQLCDEDDAEHGEEDA